VNEARRRAFARTAISGPDRVVRVASAALLSVITVVTVVNNISFRTFEAALSSRLAGPFLPAGVHAFRDIIWLPSSSIAGLEITSECTALLILAPLLVVSALLLAVTSLPWWRFAAATVSMVAVVMLANVIRIVLICWATQRWGVTGYDVTHLFIGTVLGVLGFAAGVATLALVIGARRRRVFRTPTHGTSN